MKYTYLIRMHLFTFTEVLEGRKEDSVYNEDDFNQCTINPCLNQGICQLDDNLGYRCLCPLGKTGVLCKQSKSWSILHNCSCIIQMID